MGQRGELNKEFGVYRSLCCGLELPIAGGNLFPDCPNHPNLPTVWKSVSDGRIPKATELISEQRKEKDPAA